jgi:hypothetical protein
MMRARLNLIVSESSESTMKIPPPVPQVSTNVSGAWPLQHKGNRDREHLTAVIKGSSVENVEVVDRRAASSISLSIQP